MSDLIDLSRTNFDGVRRLGHPDFIALRSRLLAELAVTEPNAVSGPP